MADINDKHKKNVPGKFFVDQQCIDCDICTEEAPDNFKRNEADGYYFVAKQPTTPAEEKKCQAALEMCPVDAIGIAPNVEVSEVAVADSTKTRGDRPPLSLD